MYLSINAGVPNSAKELIWNVFFASRQRGIDLDTHFPWINQTDGIHCIAISESKATPIVATLVLRVLNIVPGILCAMIGMVCVANNWRRQGLSTNLLNNINTICESQKIKSLVLWTGQPAIYQSHGFEIDLEVCDAFTLVNGKPLQQENKINYKIIAANKHRGLPPFAEKLFQIESHDAELMAIKTPQGMAVAEWSGSLDSVLDLIDSALPATWNLNAAANDPIINALLSRGHACTSLPCAKRLIRHIDKPITLPYISVLDRI